LQESGPSEPHRDRPELTTLWWSYSGAAKLNKYKAASGNEIGIFRMMFTGTMIDDLIAAVERAEARTQNMAPMEIEPWIASAPENAEYDSNLVWQESGVA
jgi:hypothetical protein